MALLDLATEGGGAAAFDGGHDAALGGGQRGGETLTESLSVVAEDIGHLHFGAGHWADSAGCGRGTLSRGTDGGRHLDAGQVQVAGGGGEAAMAEQELDSADVGAGFEQVNGETMSQRMGREGLGEAGQAQGFPAGQVDSLGGEGGEWEKLPERAIGQWRDAEFASSRAGPPAAGVRA